MEKNSPANAGDVRDMGSTPGMGRSSGGTHSSILAWRIPTDRGAWQATVHGVTESDMTEQLSTSQNWELPGKGNS